MAGKLVDILLIEDDPGDVELTREGLRSAKMLVNLHVVTDGVEALAFLRNEPPHRGAPRPDLILLDLNLPRKDGREVLKEIKGDDRINAIPVVVLTTSESDRDVLRCYSLGANCYLAKPVGFAQFIKLVQAMEEFWFTLVKIPPKEK